MTPIDYADCYWNLQVPIAGAAGTELRTVKIHKYLLVNMNKPDVSLPDKDELLSKTKAHLKKEGTVDVEVVRSINGTRQSFIFTDWDVLPFILLRPFVGKGSPEENQVVLQLAVRYGLATKETMQNYADDHLGLDCNGFVGNYIRQVYDSTLKWYGDKSDPINGSTRIRDLMHKTGARKKSVAELTFAGIHMMGLVDGSRQVVNTSVPAGHIVISEPFTLSNPVAVAAGVGPAGVMSFVAGAAIGAAKAAAGARPSLEVVESTGANHNGLVTSTYVIKSVDKDGIFHLGRGLGMGSLAVQVFTLR
jgi:hypothetical protein